MRVGIFGDSYADSGNALGNYGWNQLLSDKFSVGIHSRSGTSLWWSYEKFLEHYTKYDVIIFSVTNTSRWPIMPDGFEHRAWNIGYCKENDDFLDVLNPYFFELFPEKFSSFINTSIYKEIVQTCITNKKYLITVIPFTLAEELTDVELDPKFPILTGLDKISHMEEVVCDGLRQNTGKCLTELKVIDHRHCHLNPSNNRIVADWMIDCIEQKKRDVIFAGESFTDWVLFDPLDSEMLELVRKTK